MIMKTTLLILFLSSWNFAFVQAQEIDQARMDKDLEVAENILGTLIGQIHGPKGRFFHGDRNIEGTYLKDFGVMFRLNQNLSVWGIVAGEDREVIVYGDDVKVDKLGEKSAQNLKSAITDFLVDYSSLIHQLKPDDKIMVKAGSRGRHYPMSSKSARVSLSMELTKRDLDAFESGDLTRDQVVEKIVSKESTTDYKKEPQLEVFASLVDRLYTEDLSETYYLAGRPTYERVADFGVTYYLKFYSSQIHDDDLYSLPTVNKNKISKKERDEIVDDMYPTFLASMKENILEYGHTLKNLNDSEMIVFDIKLTSCNPCDMPARIELSLSKSLISDYRNQKINLDQAMKSIDVKIVG